MLSSAFLTYQNCGKTNDLESSLSAVDSKNSNSFPKVKILAAPGSRVILTVPPEILGETQVGEFQWRHLPYKGNPLDIKITSHRYLIESFKTEMAGLFSVTLPRDAKYDEYLFVVDATMEKEKDSRLCAMVISAMIHPQTNSCVIAHNSCEEVDFKDQGYVPDTKKQCPEPE